MRAFAARAVRGADGRAVPGLRRGGAKADPNVPGRAGPPLNDREEHSMTELGAGDMLPKVPVVPPELRREYTHGEFGEADALPDPVDQFAIWFAEAQSAGVPEANAMALATADAGGAPS